VARRKSDEEKDRGFASQFRANVKKSVTVLKGTKILRIEFKEFFSGFFPQKEYHSQFLTVPNKAGRGVSFMIIQMGDFDLKVLQTYVHNRKMPMFCFPNKIMAQFFFNPI
jgi:hypothetical protein